MADSAQGFGQAAGLGRFAGAFAAFKSDEPSASHARTMAGLTPEASPKLPLSPDDGRVGESVGDDAAPGLFGLVGIAPRPDHDPPQPPPVHMDRIHPRPVAQTPGGARALLRSAKEPAWIQ